MTGLTDAQLIAIAEQLDAAQGGRREIERITRQHPELDVNEAYAIQRALRRFAERRGDRVVAIKGGLTSKAKQITMKVHEPIYGFVTERMVLEEGEDLRTGELIHPRAEPEFAFFLSADLRGPGVTPEQALEATESIAPAIEIIDSRYTNFDFTLVDVVADNASSARVAIGSQRVRPEDLDLRLIGMVFEKNGEIVETGAGAAVLGHPALAIAWIANKLAEAGDYLKAGDFVMPGAVANAHPVVTGDQVRVSFDRLGTFTLQCG